MDLKRPVEGIHQAPEGPFNTGLGGGEQEALLPDG
ncbi:MAG: hypothetical protein QOJ25_3447 [Solirubrobacteraceae bacterium]|nr:hypothetical protein [Solirubrobacteraceae bacterium]